jgi:hypothetical protein
LRYLEKKEERMRVRIEAGIVAVMAAALLAACQAPASRDVAPGAGRSSETSGEEPSRKGGGLLGALKPEPVTLPSGKILHVVLETGVSSASNHPGDRVVGRVSEDVTDGEKVVVPAGSELRGQVTSVAAADNGIKKGRAHLAFDFDRLAVKDKEYPVETRAVDMTAGDTHKRDAEIVGGGAGAGAIIGAIVGGKKGAAIGGLVGAGAGGGVVVAKSGRDVAVPAGSRLSVKLLQEARLE